MKHLTAILICNFLLVGCGSQENFLNDKRSQKSAVLDQEHADAESVIHHNHDPYADEIEPFFINDPEAWTYKGQLSLATLTAFRQAPQQTVKVLELKYFPLSGDKIDKTVVGNNTDISYEDMRDRVNKMSNDLVARLALGSQTLKPGSLPYLRYEVIETKEFKKPVPTRYHEDQWHKAYYADHVSMFEAETEICHYVDTLGVRDVWVWMYHHDGPNSVQEYRVAPIESNMSMGRISSLFFNYPTHGDISNSYLLNDLPVCKHTYVVYEFNYYRGVAEALHNYGHQRERIYRWTAGTLWQDLFEAPYGSDGSNSCGNVHYPPNAEFGYDYENKRTVKSYCSQWRPDLSGAIENISCEAWGCTHEDYMVWWNRRIPGRDNNLKDGERTLRNYHEFFADFDKAVAIIPSTYQLPIKVADESNFQINCPRHWEVRCKILVPEVTRQEKLCRHLLVPKGDPLPPADDPSYKGGTVKNADSCIADETLNLTQIPIDSGVFFDFYVLFDGEPILKITP